MYRDRIIGVVVPAYNERELITEAITAIPAFIDRVYVVDDGSIDGTDTIVKEHICQRLRLLRHDKNRGVGAAIFTGYRAALADNCDFVTVMAGDNQMDAAYLGPLLDPLIDGKADYTKGTRFTDGRHLDGMSGWRFFGNTVLSISTKIASGYWHVSDSQHGYTAISRSALGTLVKSPFYPYYGYCNDILIRLSVFEMRVLEIPMPSRYRNEVSKIKYGRYIIRVSCMLVRGFVWRISGAARRNLLTRH